jgi:hypothetical protein
VVDRAEKVADVVAATEANARKVNAAVAEKPDPNAQPQTNKPVVH